ncbi:ATP-binding protein [Methanobrevibacter olleyae]|uniref:ATPase n=1 Tax=Methanobrevibacter olleyae TaxID=294671 RepID=A0A126R1J4_METOL|nr:ATP-binding protein [Methanobrevibacter olleyae]AMK16260.1 ATPase [Methanobrevibacter olleyae]
MIIKRTEYIDKIKPFINKPIIKVLIGPRRSGKSTILKQIIDYLIEEGIKEENIIWINFELSDYFEIDDINKLENFISDKTKNLEGEIYLFFDEIQAIPKWEKLINSYFAKGNHDIYITGSNSKLLSGEFATYLSGRYLELNVYPFSFKEYITYYNISNDFKTHFYNYLENGGMPSTFDYEGDNRKVVLMDLYNSIVLKDIVQRNNIKNVDLLDRIMRFVMYNISQTFSANKIYNRLKQDMVNLSVNTIYNYLKYFENACLIYQVKRENLESKKILKHEEKYYLCDLGFRQVMIGHNQRDITRVIENIVYIELLRKGYNINIGKFGDLEIDFVCKKQSNIIYVQVSYLLASDETIEREFALLNKIKDNYPKYIITMDDADMSNNGIKHLNLVDFLLGNSDI